MNFIYKLLSKIKGRNLYQAIAKEFSEDIKKLLINNVEVLQDTATYYILYEFLN